MQNIVMAPPSQAGTRKDKACGYISRLLEANVEWVSKD